MLITFFHHYCDACDTETKFSYAEATPLSNIPIFYIHVCPHCNRKYCLDRIFPNKFAPEDPSPKIIFPIYLIYKNINYDYFYKIIDNNRTIEFSSSKDGSLFNIKVIKDSKYITNLINKIMTKDKNTEVITQLNFTKNTSDFINSLLN